jgi:NADH-quinone oxidoreductase subunit H
VGLGFGIIPGLKDFHFWGLGQPLADGLKFILKEDYRPRGVDRVLFTLAPALMIIVVIISIAVIPWGGAVATRHVGVDLTPHLNDGKTLDQALAAAMPRTHRLMGDVELRTFALGARPESVEPVVIARRALESSAAPTIRPGPNEVVEATFTSGWFFQIANLNVGVLFILATLSLAVYGVVIGGWASNNKYSFLGGLRATANMISYEIPLGLSVIVVVLMFGSLDLNVIVERQAGYWLGFIPAWNMFTQPLAFLLFVVCIHAEANRAPFDIAEAEQELVGGYHTEYSSMRFALFFLAEYAGMITTSALCAVLFFGGWHLPWIEWLWPSLAGGTVEAHSRTMTDSVLAAVARGGIVFAKALLVMFIFMWVRWSLPRFRFDQILTLAWRGLIPISLVLVIGTAIVVYFTQGASFVAMDGWTALWFFVMNIAALVAVVLGSFLLPPAPETNRRMTPRDSRFTQTPKPAWSGTI